MCDLPFFVAPVVNFVTRHLLASNTLLSFTWPLAFRRGGIGTRLGFQGLHFASPAALLLNRTANSPCSEQLAVRHFYYVGIHGHCRYATDFVKRHPALRSCDLP